MKIRSLPLAVAVCVILLNAVGFAQAGVYTFVPTPADLNDLDHHNYYSWGINWTIPSGEEIGEAVLTIDKITNWDSGTNHLYIHLLDNPALGVKVFTDNQGGGDNWAGAGPLIATYIDTNGPSKTENLAYSFSSLGLIDDLTTFASDGRFGFGYDPDCHFYNCGVKFTINTRMTPVPEPGSLIALMTGIISAVGLRRRMK